MATSTEPKFELSETGEESFALAPTVRAILKPLASLKITVVLFALSIFLVLAGTLAQTKYDVWYVVHNYFRAPIAWIEFQVFFPKSFFPNLGPVPGVFPFPGGWLIGGAMAVNLFAAHAVRFTIQAKGSNLLSGLALLGLGMITTALVILGGSSDGLKGAPVFEWSTLWTICKVVLAGLCAAAVWGSAQIAPERTVERRVAFTLTGLLAAVVALLFVKGETFALGDSSMRILWQLIQGTLAGGVLLAGCWLLFKKRAGIVLLHGGIGLMMLSELLVGTTAIEGQMHIREGDTVNFVQDIRSVELAVIDTSDEREDHVTVIPHSLIVANDPSQNPEAGVISDEKLPFDVRVVQFLKNSDVRMLKPDEKNPATKGLGLEMFAEEAAASTGTTNSEKVDESAIYVEFLKKGTTESLGTYLFSLLQSRLQESRLRSGMSAAEVRSSTGPFLAKISEPTTIEVDGKPYTVALRCKRTYKPFAMKLLDVRTTYYPGTTTPKDYSSTVHITDATRDVDREVRIWMNNPLRFAGETFYQQTVGPDPITGEEMTGLQVVTNSGWMIPYVSCMIVGVGMLFQFTLVLLRFLKRRAVAEGPVVPVRTGEPAGLQPELGQEGPRRSRRIGKALAIGIVGVCALWIASRAREPRVDSTEFDLYAAGKIPVLYTGRVKPLDTLARNALQVISNRDSLAGLMDAPTLKRNWERVENVIRRRWPGLDEKLTAYATPERLESLARLIETKTKSDPEEVRDILYKATSERQPAIRWLLDLVSGRPEGKRDRIFRIENDEVLQLLGLKRREGFLYSLLEIIEKSDKFNEEVDKVRKKPAESLTTYERKLMELDRRIRSFTAIDATFRQPKIDLTDAERARIRQVAPALKAQLASAEERLIEQGHPPLIVPLQVKSGDETTYKWTPYVSAWTRDYFESQILEERPADPAVAGWDAILTSYQKGEANEFNRAVRKYQSLMQEESPPEINSGRVQYEAFFNHFDPFFLAWILYIGCFVLTVLSWLPVGGNSGISVRLRSPLQRVATIVIGPGPINRAAFWLCAFTLLVHTFALVSRIYISGRPPVTNLYSSAIFIGWGCVLLGLILEAIFRLGIGNAIASMAGFATLFISFKLAGDGDTFTVMQAVLDTQFWLATHVTCITLGYATTFLSGLLGVFYILKGVVTPSLTLEVGKNFSRMIYGTLCFAIFFSFVGTVLGGLWADDSWGRFWGWDPKENGALIIVLWNALVLHARWDGMVRDRGMAVLAVVGNVVTAWSWFGVNELGIGLHSYGFTEGVLLALGAFVASQLVIVGIGCLPKAIWLSNLRQKNALTA